MIKHVIEYLSEIQTLKDKINQMTAKPVQESKAVESTFVSKQAQKSINDLTAEKNRLEAQLKIKANNIDQDRFNFI